MYKQRISTSVFAIVLLFVFSAISNANSTAANLPFLWPQPKSLAVSPGEYKFGSSVTIHTKSQDVAGPAKLLQRELASLLGCSIDTDSTGTPTIHISLEASVEGPEGYTLRITPQAIVLLGSDEAGLYRGIATLLQLVRQSAANLSADGAVSLPAVQITDRPDVARRGMALQWCFAPVETTILHDTVKSLAMLKYNTIVPEFGQYLHNERYADQVNPRSLSRQEYRAFVQYAYSWGLDVVPLIETLAHTERGINWVHPLGGGLDMGEEENYTQLFHLLQCYKEDCPKIHYILLGMDEASACLMENSKKYGKPTDVLLANHIARVTDWCRTQGITPVIYHDMLLGSQEPMYWREGVALGTDIESYPARQKIAKDITLCYWNYEGFSRYRTVEGLMKEGFKVWMMPWGGESSYTMPRNAAIIQAGIIGSTWSDFSYNDTFTESGLKNWNSIVAYRWLSDAFATVGGYAWNASAPVRNGFDPGFDPAVVTIGNFWDKSSYLPTASTPIELPKLPRYAVRPVREIAEYFPGMTGRRSIKGVNFAVQPTRGVVLGNIQPVDNTTTLAQPQPWVLYLDGEKYRTIDLVNAPLTANKLALYTREFGISTRASQYGVEANYRCGLTDYCSTWGVGNMAIPRNGFVLSGEGEGLYDSPALNGSHMIKILDANGKEVRLGIRPEDGRESATIPIGGKASSLVFLQTTAYEAAEFMPDIASVIVHYADASTVTTDLRYGRDICSYDDVSFLYGTESPRAKWLAVANVGRELHDGKLLYAYQWQNPKPTQRISSVEIRLTPLGKQIGYILFGVSAVQ